MEAAMGSEVRWLLVSCRLLVAAALVYLYERLEAVQFRVDCLELRAAQLEEASRPTERDATADRH